MTRILAQPKLPVAFKLLLAFGIIWGFVAVIVLFSLDAHPSTLTDIFINVGAFTGVVSIIVSLNRLMMNRKTAVSSNA